ncbi:MAG: FTR1 family protein [Helicobacter sp.]|nr:FTR1 family protein [Helicobacter sp.]
MNLTNWNFAKVFCFLLIFGLFSSFLGAKEQLKLSPFFIEISNSMSLIKENKPQDVAPKLAQFELDFKALSASNSPKGKLVLIALTNAKATPDLDNLKELSRALIAFENEQNPPDYTAKINKFIKQVNPLLNDLENDLKLKNKASVQTNYARLNVIWKGGETAVRAVNSSGYGKFELGLALFRSAMILDDFNSMQMQVDALKNVVSNIANPTKTTEKQLSLKDGITLLENALDNLESNPAKAKADIINFISAWSSFEGEVSTRDSSLYKKVESDLPLILAKGTSAKNDLSSLISSLKQIDISQSYGVLDAMIVLLREGIEALLIILALISALNASGQNRAKSLVYIGSGIGVLASIGVTFALQGVYAAFNGNNREILEGIVGVIAVITMLFVGAWLHSKSSLKGWQAFLNRQFGKALGGGGIIGLVFLAFLAVFREGGETILFYAGMLPLISIRDFLLGIALAVIILFIISVVIIKSSKNLPVHHVFKFMSFLIYILGFKILGVSIHSLQLTNILPSKIFVNIWTVDFIGFYPSLEGMLAQLAYVILIPIVAMLFKAKETRN